MRRTLADTDELTNPFTPEIGPLLTAALNLQVILYPERSLDTLLLMEGEE